MTYRPEECVFGPPWTARIPSILYLVSALVIGVLVLIGENSARTSALFEFVVADDARRVMSMRTLSIVLLIGGLSSVLRSTMRGVRIYAEGVETRDVENFIVPKVRRYMWVQMERVVLDFKSSVALDLWDGSRALLPAVNDRKKLAAALERVAMARAIPVRGGSGLDDIPEPADDSPRDSRVSLKP